MKVVIRAGGSGTRLWPLSRKGTPKQFLPLLGRRSLFEEKVVAVRPLVRSWNDLFVSVTAPFIQTVRKLAPRIPVRNIIVEPVGRNTGPAIGLESVVIQAQATGVADPVIASLTVDDVFADTKKFLGALRASEQFCKQHSLWIVTVASRVAKPDPGLSYIELDRSLGPQRRQRFHRVKRWVEKPTGAFLTRLHRHPRVFAHTGLYVWKASTILSLFEQHQPQIFQKLQLIQHAHGTPSFDRVLRRVYPTLPRWSIEEAITNRVRHIAVASGAFGWSDTGKWHLVKDLKAVGARNVLDGTVITENVTDSLISVPKGKVAAVLGLDGVIVVDTGDALLVCPKERSGDVKTIVGHLKKKHLTKFL